MKSDLVLTSKLCTTIKLWSTPQNFMLILRYELLLYDKIENWCLSSSWSSEIMLQLETNLSLKTASWSLRKENTVMWHHTLSIMVIKPTMLLKYFTNPNFLNLTSKHAVKVRREWAKPFSGERTDTEYVIERSELQILSPPLILIFSRIPLHT